MLNQEDKRQIESFKIKNSLKLFNTKYAESIFDIVYMLESKDKDAEDNYFLLKLYFELGWMVKCERLMESLKSNKSDCSTFQKLFDKINRRKNSSNEIIEIRDLRKARERLQMPKLEINDFIVSEEENRINLKFISNTKSQILFNKVVDRNYECVEFDFPKESDFSTPELIQKLNHYFIWLNTSSLEFIKICKNNLFQGNVNRLIKYCHDIDEWYDGLEIVLAGFSFNENEDLEAYFLMFDYYNECEIDIDTFNNTFESIDHH